VCLAVLALLVAGPAPQSKAVEGGLPAGSSSGSVRIFEGGRWAASGTLVDRNWALTSLHVFRRLDLPHTLRFGVLNNDDDPRSTANLRTIDQVVVHPQLADVVMVHFADPVPPGTWIAPLATQAPGSYTAARLYGWTQEGHILQRALGLILDPVAQQNAAHLRAADRYFGKRYPGDIQPMAVNIQAEPGDSGSGIFSAGGLLLGVTTDRGEYSYQFNASGDPVGTRFTAAYAQPVWQHRAWIQRVISGEGSSGSQPGPPRRQLTSNDTTSTQLPMTLPPQDGCDTGTTCPQPVWEQGALLGAGNYRGTALARCATAANNTCTFGQTTYPTGTSTRIPLGPATAPGTAPRQVMIWCKTSTSLTPGDPARDALRISFTNADPQESPLGYGWWDITPDQLGTGNGNTPLDPSQFTPC
jgi:hypothetical protein